MKKIYARSLDPNCETGKYAVLGAEECAGGAEWLAEHGESAESIRQYVLNQYDDQDGLKFDLFNGRLIFPEGFDPQKETYTVLYFDENPLKLYEISE